MGVTRNRKLRKFPLQPGVALMMLSAILCSFPKPVHLYDADLDCKDILIDGVLQEVCDLVDRSDRVVYFLDPNLKLNRITNTEDNNNFMYYHQNIACQASFSVQPTSLNQLQDVVRFALKNNYRVKSLGKGHTATDTICTDGILVDMKNIKHISFNPETNRVTVGAGMELSEFLETIHSHGRGLTGAPSYGGVSIGGAVAAGTHGTNVKEAATLSDQVVSLTFVDGEGNVRQLKEGEEDFKAMKINLGLLGIVYEFTLRTTKQYKLDVRNFPMSDEILWRGREILDMAEKYDTFQFFWFPTNKQIVAVAGTKVHINTTGNCKTNSIPVITMDRVKPVYGSLDKMQGDEDELGYFHAQSLAKLGLYETVPGRRPFYTLVDGEDDHGEESRCLPAAIGYSHQIMTSSFGKELYPILYDDGAVLVDLSEMEGVLQTVKGITDDLLVGFPLGGINFRFVKESDAYMGLNRNQPSLQIELLSRARRNVTQPKLGITAIQAIGQALVERHGARPHWGKNGLHYLTHPIIQRAYPDLPKFINVMNRMDPHEVFMNDFGRRLKHGESAMTLTEDAKLRCALNEACVCKDDLDCGDGTPSAYVCGDYREFKVCKKQPTPSNLLKDVTNRDAINSAAKFSDDQVYMLEALAPYNGLRYMS